MAYVTSLAAAVIKGPLSANSHQLRLWLPGPGGHVLADGACWVFRFQTGKALKASIGAAFGIVPFQTEKPKEKPQRSDRSLGHLA